MFEVSWSSNTQKCCNKHTACWTKPNWWIWVSKSERPTVFWQCVLVIGACLPFFHHHRDCVCVVVSLIWGSVWHIEAMNIYPAARRLCTTVPCISVCKTELLQPFISCCLSHECHLRASRTLFGNSIWHRDRHDSEMSTLRSSHYWVTVENLCSALPHTVSYGSMRELLLFQKLLKTYTALMQF